MKILVTGSAGHLGEALMRVLRGEVPELAPPPGAVPLGVDRLPSPYTDRVGSLVDRAFAAECLAGVDAVLHAATLHKPHVATHSRQDFVDVNVTATLNLLEEAARGGASAFVFTSTTSAFGHALVPRPGEPAAWITEDVSPVPKNIYGATKTAAEDLCQLVHQDQGLPCVVLRTSRFFPEEDDLPSRRDAYPDENLKANELLHRRLDLEDAARAHLDALARAPVLGFGRYVISATTPFTPEHRLALRGRAAEVVAELFPEQPAEWARRGWSMPEDIERVYVNARARDELGWVPRYDFGAALGRLLAGEDPRSPLARAVGAKGYHRVAGEAR